MIELVGKPLSFAKAVLGAIGKKYTIKNNYSQQQFSNPIHVVTSANEKNGVLELVVGEFYLGE